MNDVSPIYVHGAKHLLNKVRQQIVSAINKIPHDAIIDPFCGSGTLVALDERATHAYVNFGPGTRKPAHNAVCGHILQSGAFEDVEPYNRHFDDFLEYFFRHESPLLILDPPRPGSKQYGTSFTKIDADHLLAQAIEWEGPVVMAYYEGDMPRLEGAGWTTKSIVIDVPLYNLSDPSEQCLKPMLAVKETVTR